MESVSLIELAKKEIYNANYLYTVTLPLVNEPKLLLSVLTRIQKALEYAITELVDLEIKYKNEDGEEQTLKASGLLARIFQHEIDHLDGILFIDKARKLMDISY